MDAASPDPPREALSPGTVLGEFELQQLIGVGGTAIVYLAQDRSLQRPVAVKEYMPASLCTRTGPLTVSPRSERHRETFEAGMRSFINEARLLASFDHPALLKVYRFWEANGTAYMVMPFLEGMTLKEALRQRSAPPDEAQLVELLSPLSAALDVLHQAHCVHRDVAPDNIMMLAGSNRPLLLDFGAARLVIGDALQSLTVILKPGFAPVEQYAEVPGMTQGPWTDVYALAGVVHLAITGRVPPPAVGRLLKDSYQPLRDSQRGRYSDRFLAAVDAALAVRPENRLRSMASFRHALGIQPALTPASSWTAQDPASAPPLHVPRASVARPMTAAAPNLAEPTAQPTASKGTASRVLLAPLVLVTAPVAWLWRALVNPWNGSASPAPRRLADERIPPAVTPDDSPEPDMQTQIRPRNVNPLAAPPPLAPDEGGGHTMILPSLQLRPADGGGLAAQLVVSASPHKAAIGQVLAVGRSRLVIGRGESAQLRLDDALVSAEHAAVDWSEGGYGLVELGSRNGTFVNGRRVPPLQREPLALGSMLQLGDSVLSFMPHRPAPPPDLSGGEIASLYRLERRLRQSPKGAVYAARHLRTGASLAIKLLASDVVAYPGYREHFERVVAASRRLQHPNICPVIDSGQGEILRGSEAWPTTFLCHPLLTGGNLADRLADDKPIALAQAMNWLAAIAAALSQAHRQGLVHGDLKPSAICFDDEANVYLTDFGLVGSAGSEAALMGSPPYMAPEQWDRVGVDARTDQFALAAVGYVLLTGALPFEGQIDPRVRERNFLRGPMAAHEEARRLARAALSPAVSDVLKRALAVKPSARFESVGAMFAALQAAVEQEGGGERPPVFLSYQRGPGTTPLAHLLRRELQDRHQIACFLDSREESGAGSFPEELSAAIGGCRVFVCLLSQTTLSSDWVRSEIATAHRHGRPMIPVLLESFVAPATALDEEPAIHALLHSKGEPLSDARGVLLDEGVARVIRRVRETLARPPG